MLYISIGNCKQPEDVGYRYYLVVCIDDIYAPEHNTWSWNNDIIGL